MFVKARSLPALLIIAIIWLTAESNDTASAADSQTDRPNILFILLDNVGKDWFRCYGSSEDQTPVIDGLARSGLKFRNFYVTPVCSTTRVMLLSGRYPFRTGWHTHHDPAIYGGGYYDWEREICMARVMKSAGYDTCISGKWQINDLFDPEQQDAINRHGFDDYCLFPEGKKGHPAHKNRYWDAYVIRNGEKLDTKGQFGPDVFTNHLIDFMGRDRDRPFFAYYSTILTHIPVVETPHNKGQNLTPRELFAGMLSYMDHLIGRLVKSLEETGQRDNTIIFIAVDNGTDNGTDQNAFQSLGGRINGRVSGEGIYSLSERGINVPFIVNCPNLVPQGRESDDLIDASDILPTLAALGKAPLPDGLTIDGRSFAPQVLGQPHDEAWRPWCLTQYYKTRVVRGERFKLYSTGEFYDLSEDPLEQHNLAETSRLTDTETASSHRSLQAVLNSLPDNAMLPWEFRSISARKIRAEEEALRKKQQSSRPAR
ncbi:MAG: sulfatase-like hydrolase/transferase [Planctomycetota bacterium]